MRCVTKNTTDSIHYDVVSNWHVVDMDESIVASGYPMYKTLPQFNVKNGFPSVGEKSCKRAERLATVPCGSGHDCFLKGILVSFDLTATVKMWTQAERYGHFHIVSSMSTMHMLTSMEAAFIEYTDTKAIQALSSRLNVFALQNTEDNLLRTLYSYPSGLLLTARVTTNYLQLKTVYKQRRTHKLPEWQEFCDWIEELPYSYLITGKDGDIEDET